MSWNYMQPNAGLLQYAGAGMNNLGKGLLGMSQQVQEIPYHQKRLGLLDAQRNATNNQGLLWRHQAEIAAKDAASRADKNQADINNTNANTAYTNSRTIGQNIENTYKPKSIMADINHKYAQTGYVNSGTQLNSQALREQMLTEDLKLKRENLAYMQQMLPNIAAGYRNTLSGNELAKFDALTPEQQQAASNAFGAQLILEVLGYNMPQPPQPQQPQQPTNQHPQAFSKPTPKMLPSDDWNAFGRF